MLPLQKRPLERNGEENKENEAPEKKSKVIITPEQEENFKESFKDGKKLSLKQAREFLMEHPEMFDERTEKIIQDKHAEEI